MQDMTNSLPSNRIFSQDPIRWDFEEAQEQISILSDLNQKWDFNKVFLTDQIMRVQIVVQDKKIWDSIPQVTVLEDQSQLSEMIQLQILELIKS